MFKRKKRDRVTRSEVNELIERIDNLDKELFGLNNKPKFKSGDKVNLLGLVYHKEGDIINLRGIEIDIDCWGNKHMEYEYNILVNDRIIRFLESELSLIKAK